MKYLSVIFCPTLVLFGFCCMAQTFKTDTISFNGNPDKFINIVIMGDGYTATEQAKFRADASSLSTYLFNQPPWSNYKSFFNIFAIEAISEQSGTKHPYTASDCSSASPMVPVTDPNTIFGVTFDYANIHRLVVPTNYQNIVNTLISNFPKYDQVIILANSPYYGGSGGSYATSTTGSSSFEVTAHELGHSFAFLADEYYAGDSYASERTNMTQQTNTDLVKWKNWLGFKDVGIYQHCCGGQSDKWYRPHNNCKMRVLGPEFCPVCSENTVKRIHNLVGTNIVARFPVENQIYFCSDSLKFNLSLAKPNPNTLKVVWDINGVIVAKNIDSVSVNKSHLSAETNILRATVTDTTLFIRDPSHNSTHTNITEWKINKVKVPEIIIHGNDQICQGDSVNLSSTEAIGYWWSNGQNTKTITVFSSGTYNVTTSDIFGCPATSSPVTIVVNPRPTVTLVFPKDTFCLSTLPLTLSGGMPENRVFSGYGVDNGVLTLDFPVPGWQNITYTYINEKHCADSVTALLFLDICSSTESPENDLKVSVIPNPTFGKFRLNFDQKQDKEMLNCSVYNSTGTFVLEIKNPDIDIDLSSQPKGTYFIRILTGEKTKILKLILH
ncbi:MAG: T9SS type A sorting domain-containing protein [Saprospiraceae bacterium]|nr:T9SS type A sorting domain-containing protein [Saprospiraceae bacterium]